MAERGKRASVQVGNLGKWKTALQMISIGLLLASCPDSSSLDSAAASGSIEVASIHLMRSIQFSSGLVTFYIATLLTVVSGLQYFQAAWPALKDEMSAD